MSNIDVLETYETPTDSSVRTGGLVRLIRTLVSGDIVDSWELPLNAITLALFGAENGYDVKSCRIEWGSVSRGVLDVSGSAMAVEWSTIRKPYVDEDNNLGLG